MSRKINFKEWCIKYNHSDFLELWDYKLNEMNGLTPENVIGNDKRLCYFKCEKGLHDSRAMSIKSITTNHALNKCIGCNSFGQWCLDNNRIDLLERWDLKLNGVDAFHVSMHTHKKYYLKCPRNLHDSEQFIIYNLVCHNTDFLCKKCNSFAQVYIDLCGSNFLEIYWDYEKNIIDPWEISHCGETMIWLKCQNEHCCNSYILKTSKFYPHRYCPKCYLSQGEHVITAFLNSNNIYYEPQKTFNNLVGIGNGLLSYDFYLPYYNMCIEFQGQQHEEPIDYFGGKEQFERQQEHDRRKRQYALDNNIKLLEIWYYDFDNIDKILTEELNLPKHTTLN